MSQPDADLAPPGEHLGTFSAYYAFITTLWLPASLQVTFYYESDRDPKDAAETYYPLIMHPIGLQTSPRSHLHNGLFVLYICRFASDILCLNV